MSIYHLPFTYHFKSSEKLNYFLIGNVGYSRTQLADKIQERSSNVTLSCKNHIKTYTAGLGGGARYKVKKDLTVSGGVEFIYSRAGASVSKPDRQPGDVIEDFFNTNYSDNLSYKVFTVAEYRPMINEYKPYITASYKLYETKSNFSFSNITSFSSQSSVGTISLGLETAKLYAYSNNYLTSEIYGWNSKRQS